MHSIPAPTDEDEILRAEYVEGAAGDATGKTIFGDTNSGADLVSGSYDEMS